MQIAVYGPGRIGSTFAFYLARAEHDVTLIARGRRLVELERDRAIASVSGERAEVKVAAALDPTVPWDLVLVTVLAPQVEAILPSLKASAAKSIMFMFNTYDPIAPLAAAVGPERFAFGFPAILANFVDGKLKAKVYNAGQVTTVTDARWAKVFSDAGIKTVVHEDMHSWLRSHAAFVVPLMLMGVTTNERNAGLTFAESLAFARAWTAGFRLVRALGHRVTPGVLNVVSRLIPTFVIALLFWMLSRTATIRETGRLGPEESRMLIDQATAAAPGHTGELLAIRR